MLLPVVLSTTMNDMTLCFYDLRNFWGCRERASVTMMWLPVTYFYFAFNFIIFLHSIFILLDLYEVKTIK